MDCAFPIGRASANAALCVADPRMGLCHCRGRPIVGCEDRLWGCRSSSREDPRRPLVAGRWFAEQVVEVGTEEIGRDKEGLEDLAFCEAAAKT